MSEPTEEDLLNAVKGSLINDGRFGRFQAEIRSAVISILNKNPSKEPPKIPKQTKFINELVREYLVWNGYQYSEQILIADAFSRVDLGRMTYFRRQSFGKRKVKFVKIKQKLQRARHSKSFCVLCKRIESGQSNERHDRENLATKLGVKDDAQTEKIPLLYYVVSAFQNQQNSESLMGEG